MASKIASSMAVHLASCRPLMRKYLFSFNFLVLLIFTFQNSSAVLLMSYTQQRYDTPATLHKKYITLHLLMVIELAKLCLALVWATFDIYAEVRKKQLARLRRRQSRATASTTATRAAGSCAFIKAEPSHAPPVSPGNIMRAGSTIPIATVRGVAEVVDSDAPHAQITAAAATATRGAAMEERQDRAPLQATSGFGGSAGDDGEGQHDYHPHRFHSSSQLADDSSATSRADGDDGGVAISVTGPRANAHGDAERLHWSARDSQQQQWRAGGRRRHSTFAMWCARFATEVPLFYLRPQDNPLKGSSAEDEEVEEVGDGANGDGDGGARRDAEYGAASLLKTGGGAAAAAATGKCRRLMPSSMLRLLHLHVNQEAFYMAVPAVAYAIQNLFMLDALGKLSPLVYQILVQLRILMMALAMKVVMKTVITPKKWVSLTVLLAGVVMGQLGAKPKPQRATLPLATKRKGTSDAADAFAPQKRAALEAGGGDEAGHARSLLLHGKMPPWRSFTSRVADGAAAAHPQAPAGHHRVVAGSFTAAAAAAAAAAGGNAGVLPDAEVAAAAVASLRFASGLTSLLFGCCISVLASVYMEAVFKKRASFSFLSTRNIHLAFFSVLYLAVLSWNEYAAQRAEVEAAMSMMRLTTTATTTRPHADRSFTNTDFHASVSAAAAAPPPTRDANGYLHYNNKIYYDSLRSYLRNYLMNFDALVWLLVFTNAMGGMITAVLLRFSDNIMKTMSTAAAIVVSGVGSYFIFGTALKGIFLVGAVLVMTAVLMYNLW